MVIGLLTIAAIPTVIGTGQAVSAQKKQNAAAKEQAKFSLTATMTIDGKREEAPCVLVDNKASLSSFFATLLRIISSIICKVHLQLAFLSLFPPLGMGEGRRLWPHPPTHTPAQPLLDLHTSRTHPPSHIPSTTAN